MKFEVLGVIRKSGDYNGNHYDNTVIQVAYDRPDLSNLQGRLVDTVKIPTVNYRNDIVVGSRIEAFYDKYGRLQDYSVL